MGGLIVILIIALFVAGLAIALLATTFAVIRAGAAHSPPYPPHHSLSEDPALRRSSGDAGDPAISALFANDLASPPPHHSGHQGHHTGHDHHGHHQGGVEYGGSPPDPGPAPDAGPSFDAGPSMDSGSFGGDAGGSCGGDSGGS